MEINTITKYSNGGEMNLTQQLEDKKKGCGVNGEIFIGFDCNDNELFVRCGELDLETCKREYCPKCEKEIAILEQAIADIKILEEELKRMNFKYGNLANKYAELQSQREMKKDDRGTDMQISPNSVVDKTLLSNPADISNLLQKQRQEILDELFGKETTKEWEDNFYESEWKPDTLKLTPLETKIVDDLTYFLPRHMSVYDWNLPYAEEVILIMRRAIQQQLNTQTEKKDGLR